MAVVRVAVAVEVIKAVADEVVMVVAQVVGKGVAKSGALLITPPKSGRSCRMKSVTRFARNVIRRESREDRSAMYWS